MEHKIISTNKNPYLGREELKVHLVAEKNPTKKEVVEALKKSEDLTVVKKIDGNFGRNTFHAEVVVYSNKEAKDKVETISRKTRKKLAEEAKKAAEAAKAAQPAA